MTITFNAANRGSTFGNLFDDTLATGETWYRLWTGSADGKTGSFVDTSKYNSSGNGNGWIQQKDLYKLKIDFSQYGDETLWVRNYEATKGLPASERWAKGAVDFSQIIDCAVDDGLGSDDSTGPGETGPFVRTVVYGDTAMNRMFNIENLTENHWIRLWVGNKEGTIGSFVDTSALNQYGKGWVTYEDLDQVVFQAPEDGESTELWVTTWTPENQYAQWDHWTVTNGDIEVLNPGNHFTLQEVVVGQEVTEEITTTIQPSIEEKVYWGYNPHAHGETGADNEGPVDGGVPIDELVSFLENYLDHQAAIMDLFDTVGMLQEITNITVAGGTANNESIGDLPTPGTGGEGGDGGDGGTGGAGGEGGDVVLGSADDPYTGTYDITIELSDGSTTTAQIELSAQQFEFINGLLFDAEGNSRLFVREFKTWPQVELKDADGNVVEDADGNPVLVDLTQVVTQEGETSDITVPIVLTPTVNNGGTLETGYTSSADDVIVAGRLELLHQAYIDGGGGHDTLEIDAKGYYAQPLALINIEQINIQNLPNVYTLPADPLGGLYDVSENTSYPDLDPDQHASYTSSIIDLSRATALQGLTITEGDFEGLQNYHVDFPGSLTITGIRNGATTTLDGSIQNTIKLNYSALQNEGVNLVFNNLSLGDENDNCSSGAQLIVAHNAETLNIESTGGGNYLYNADFGGQLSTINITGTAHLYIEGDLDDSFHDETPATIDARDNTGGVTLYLTNSENVTFYGSQGDDIFIVETDEADVLLDYIDDDSVTIIDGGGNNRFEISTEIVNMTLLDGNNTVMLEDAESIVITAGHGDNLFQVDWGTQASITVGDGNNRMEIYTETADDEGPVDLSLDYPNKITINAGDGQNVIDIEASDYTGVVDVTAGNGGNEIKAYAHEVNVATGSSADVIEAIADVIRINSGGGGDTITISGFDLDYVGEDELGGNGTASEPSAEWGHDGALVQINTGSGAATVILGSDEDYDWEDDDEFPGEGSLTLHQGSYITGENVTLVIKTVADLRALEDVSSISSVILDDDAFDIDDHPVANSAIGGVNAAVVTLTASQFAAIGAENFTVEGSVFRTHGFIKLIVTESTSLTDLGVDDLSSNIDLLLEVQDGVVLEMTAKQLHTHVAQNGVSLANDGNTDYLNGSVVITGGGADFDPFNTSDTIRTNIAGMIYLGGSLSSDFKNGDVWYNVTVDSGTVYDEDGNELPSYDRPADVPAQVVYTLNTGTGTGAVTDDGVDTWFTNLEIIGERDINFTGPIQLGEVLGVSTNAFTIDFSQLEGVVSGMTVDHFELLGQGGAIYGNSANGYDAEVLISIADDDCGDSVGFDEGTASSALVSRGVNRYVVTQIDGPTANGSSGNTATIILCDTAQDIEVFALRGNYNDTLKLVDAAWGLVFELQGGSTAKADGPTGTANVGVLDANFEWDGADAVVNLVHSVDGDTRPFKAYGIDIDNADSITINADGADATIVSIAGNSLDDLIFTSADDIAVTTVLPIIDSIDASGVVGTFAASLDQVSNGSTDFTFTGAQGGSTLTMTDAFVATDATDIDGGVGGVALVIAAGVTVDIDAAALTNVTQVTFGQGAGISLTMAQADAIGADNFALAAGATAATLNLSGLDGEEFAIANYETGITVGLVTIADLPVVTLHADTDLTNIAALQVPQGTVLNMTAAQYQQLTGAGTITGIGNTTDFTVNITDLTQADADTGLNLNGITADSLTLTLVEDVELFAPQTGIIASDLGGADISIGEFTFTLYDVMLASGLNIVGGAGSALQFTDITGFLVHSDASGFDFDFLRLPNLLVSGNNVDYMFEGLSGDITKVIFNGIGDVEGKLQNVVIEEGTTVFDDISFNDYLLDQEVTHLTLNLQGGVEIDGDLVLSTVEVNGEDPGDVVELVPYYLQELVINSTGTGANRINGETANVITGDITPAAYDNAISIGSRDNNLKSVTINAEQDLIVEGEILFSSHGSDTAAPLDNTPGDGITANDDDSAIATLTVTGSADVTLGGLNTTDDDIDGLNVVNSGTGTLSITVDAADIDDNGGNNVDALSFTGSNIALTIVGSVDLSNDVITGVSQITLADNAMLILNQAQFDALGAANLIDGGNTGSATLSLNGVNAAFDATTVDAGIDVQTLTLAGSMDFTATASNFTGVNQIVVPEGATLTLTAAQFQQLVGNGTITSVDTDGDADATEFTVNIVGLTQADIDGGSFNTSGITAATIALVLGEDVNLSADDVIENVDSLIMGDGLTLGLATQAQADDLVIDGGANTTVNLLFDIIGEIDAIGYNITTLRALAVSVDNQDVEVLIDDLPNSVTLNLYEDPSEVGYVSDIHRVVVIEPGVQVPTGFVAFNASDANREVRTLKITFQGDGTDPLNDANGNIFGAVINGNLVLDAFTPATGSVADKFNKLTLVSEGTGTSNAITGSITPIDSDGAGAKIDNNLLNIEIQAASAFTIGGDIIFNSTAAAQNAAILTVNGAAPVSIEQLMVNGSNIDTLTIDNDGGALTVTGGTPSITAGAAEEIILTGDGAITLGTVEQAEDFTDGITGAALSSVDASGLSGDLYIENISGVDQNLFSFTSGTGITDVTVTGQTFADDGNAATASGWTFDFSNAAAGSELHLGDTLFTNTYTSGALTIDLGANTTLYIDETTNLTAMTLSISQGQNIVLADGVILTLTAAQADGLNIVGANGAASTGIVNIINLGTAEYDLSGISADIAGTTTLAANDVELHDNTDLGSFSVTLLDSDTTAADETPMAGQTIRFQNEDQAARTIIVAAEDDTGANVDTNVVWLFDTISDSVETLNYSANLGRLWVTPELLANNNNVEELFTTLPSSIVRVEFASIAELNYALASVDVDRVLEMVAFTDLSATGLVFNDQDRLEHLNDLTLELGGQVQTGNIQLDNIIAPSADPLELDPTNVSFNTLTINSHRALHQGHFLAPENFINDNDGVNEQGEHVQPNNTNIVGNISVGSNNGLDLLNVNLNTGLISNIGNTGNTDAQNFAGAQGANLRVGTITFDSEGAGSTANLMVTGANSTTIASLNTTDADITTLSVTNSGTGTLSVTGASPAAAVSNTEILNVAATGNVAFGTAGSFAGVSGADLSAVNVSGTGAVNLGVIDLIDGSDDTGNIAFTYTNTGTLGRTSLTLGDANAADAVQAPSLDAGSSWTFIGNNLTDMTITSDVTLGAGTLTLSGLILTIQGAVDFTTLANLAITNATTTIVVPSGSSLTILAADADGLTIRGDGLVTVTELEATPNADLSDIMTTDGDTGTVEALVTTDAGTDVNFTGNLGKAHVTTSGDGVFDVTGATIDSVAFDHDDNAGTGDQVVKTTFTVGAGTTLVMLASQADDHTVDGAGTTNVEDIGLYAGTNVLSLAGIASAVVNIAVDTSVTLDRFDDLGAAGPGRVVTIGTGDTLTSAGSVVNGQYIVGENGTLLVDDENDGGAPDTPITADLSNVSAEFITLVVGAEVGAITFPVLYGDPVAKYDGFPLAIPPVAADPTVPVQTVTLTAVQASGQTILGANAGAEGEVVVNDLDNGFTNLSLINAGLMTAHVVDTPVTLNAGTDLGAFDVELDADGAAFTLSAAQADGISIIDGDAGVDNDATVTVTALEAAPNADLSLIDVFDEFALLDANGGVVLGANLGSNMEVVVSDSVAGGPNTVTFTGQMVSGATVFTIASDAVTLVFDADDAHQLTVAETGGGVANSAVIVNNVDGDLMNLSNIVADTMTANVPATATLHANSDFGNFSVVLAEAVELTLSFTQMLEAGLNDALLQAGDFAGTAGGVEEMLIVTDYVPATAIDTSVLLPNMAMILNVADTDTVVQVAAGTNFTGVEEIVIPDGTTLVMTADQFQQIQASVTVSGAGTLNLTNFDNDNNAIDLSSVTAQAGTITLDPAAGQITATLPELAVTNPIVLDPLAVLDNQAGAKFSILMSANNQAITFSTEFQADGRAVQEGAFTGNAIVLGFTSADPTPDADANMVATDFNVDNIYVLNQYLANEFGGVTPANIEEMLFDLDSGIAVTIYDVDAALTGGLVNPAAVESTIRVVNVESNTFVDASVAFNDLRSGTEVTELTINLNGNSIINGSLTLPQDVDPMSLLPVNYVDLFGGANGLTINSVNTSGAVLAAVNQIDGNIIGNTALGGGESQVESFTIDFAGVSIVGSQEQIQFAGVVINDLDDGDGANEVASAVAAAINTAFGVATQPLWYAADNGDGTVTFTALAAGVVTDITVADFTFTQNDPSTVLAAAITAGDITIDQQGSFEASENNLLDVNINATHALDITGKLEFSYVAGSLNIDATADTTTVATLDITGTANVNIGSVDTSDDHITGLVFTNTNSATVTIPGLSAGGAVGDTEQLIINNNGGGTITFGTNGNLDRPGLAGDDLSLIDINGTGGIVNLGVIAQVDGADFTLNTVGMEGTVNATLRADMAAGGNWTFTNADDANPATEPLNLTIVGTTAADAYGVDDPYATSFGAGGTLVLNEVNLTLEGTIDFSQLSALTITNSTVVVGPGANLILTVQQALALTGDIIGEGTITIVGDGTDANAVQLGENLKTVNIDLSAVTLDLDPVGVDGDPADADGFLSIVLPGATVGVTANLGQNVTGSDFADNITTAGGDDTISGGAGNDSLTAGAGIDSVYGEAGDDTIVGGDNAGLADGGADNDTLQLSANYAPAADANLEGVENVVSDNTGKTINLANQLGEAFNVTLGTGGDTVTTADGNDTITAGAGSDSISSGDGNDTIYSTDVSDTINGGAGAADQLVVAGNYTQPTDARLSNVEIVNQTVSDSTVNLTGQTEAFTINGTEFVALGQTGNDTLTGGSGNDTINGLSGNDALTGGAGVDSMTGGAGNDQFIYNNAEFVAAETVSGGGDTDTLVFNTSNYTTVSAGVPADGGAGPESTTFTILPAGELLNNGRSVSINGLTVTATADGFTGAQIASVFAGGTVAGLTLSGAQATPANWTGTPVISALNNTVTLTNTVVGDIAPNFAPAAVTEGEVIADSAFVNKSGLEAIDLGDGTNTLTLAANAAAATDTLTVAGGTGADTVDASALGESVTISGGNGADVLTGSALADSITGDAGNDSLIGGAGADSLEGGAGADTLVGAQDDVLLDGGADADVLQIGAAFNDTGDAQIAGIETVNLTATGLTVSLDAQTEGLTINGFAAGASTITGGAGADSITGGTGADSLIGGAGVDTLTGGAGNDTLVGAQDDALLDGGADADVLQIGANFDDTGDAQIAAVVSGFETIQLAQDADLTIAASELADNAIATVTGNALGGIETVTFTGTANADSINLSGVTTVTDAQLIVNAGAEADDIVGSAFADILNGEAGQDTITGGQGNDTMTGGAAADTFVFIDDAVAETDTITDWGVGGNNDAVSGVLGAGDQLNVTFSPWNAAGASVDPTNTDATAGGDGVVNFATSYKVGDRITITFNGTHAVTRTVQAGATSGVDVALAFESVFESLTMGTSFDQDLVDGVGAASVTAAIDGSAVLYIANDSGAGAPGSGAFTIDSTVAVANGYVFDASVIAATNGVVSVTGNDGADTITGGVNADTLVGGTGNDSLVGGAGADSLNGGDGLDIINGGTGNDTINGEAGADSLVGGAGSDSISGGAGNDTINGGADSDSLYGGADNDTFVFATAVELGADATVDGGAGTDTIQVLGTTLDDSFFATVTAMEQLYFAGTAAHSLTLGGNTDTAFATGIVISANVGATSLTVDGALSTVAMTVTGTNNGDTITGGTVADSINAGTGADIITGNEGDDTLTGGAGADTFVWVEATDGVDFITDFAVNSDLLDLTIGAIADIASGGANTNVSDAVNSGALTVAALAADTAAAAGTDLAVFSGGGADMTAIALNAGTAAIEAAILAQLSDGAADFSANITAAGQGALVLIENDQNAGGAEDSYFLASVISVNGDAVTDANEVTLLGIFNGISLAGVDTADFI